MPTRSAALPTAAHPGAVVVGRLTDVARGSMRVLVTGGAGYVGSVSVERLLDAGHDVVVLDDLSTGHREAVPAARALEVGELRRRRGDEPAARAGAGRRDPPLRGALARRRVGPRPGALLPRQRRRRGRPARRGARRRRRADRLQLDRRGLRRPATTPIPETRRSAPINPYGETKRTFEGALRFYGEAYGLRSIALRYFNVAGATERNGELHDPETHLIPNVLRAAEPASRSPSSARTTRRPDGTCIRDYIHVADLADAHLLALEATAATDGDARTDAAARPRSTSASAAGSASARLSRPPKRSSVGRSDESGPRRDRRSAGPRRRRGPRPAVLGWAAKRPTLDEMIGSAWEWRRRNLDPATGSRPAPS